jgi:hypothetical protein
MWPNINKAHLLTKKKKAYEKTKEARAVETKLAKTRDFSSATFQKYHFGEKLYFVSLQT